MIKLKRWGAILLVLCMLITAFPATSVNAENSPRSSDTYEWVLYKGDYPSSTSELENVTAVIGKTIQYKALLIRTTSDGSKRIVSTDDYKFEYGFFSGNTNATITATKDSKGYFLQVTGVQSPQYADSLHLYAEGLTSTAIEKDYDLVVKNLTIIDCDMVVSLPLNGLDLADKKPAASDEIAFYGDGDNLTWEEEQIYDFVTFPNPSYYDANGTVLSSNDTFRSGQTYTMKFSLKTLNPELYELKGDNKIWIEDSTTRQKYIARSTASYDKDGNTIINVEFDISLVDDASYSLAICEGNYSSNNILSVLEEGRSYNAFLIRTDKNGSYSVVDTDLYDLNITLTDGSTYVLESGPIKFETNYEFIIEGVGNTRVSDNVYLTATGLFGQIDLYCPIKINTDISQIELSYQTNINADVGRDIPLRINVENNENTPTAIGGYKVTIRRDGSSEILGEHTIPAGITLDSYYSSYSIYELGIVYSESACPDLYGATVKYIVEMRDPNGTLVNPKGIQPVTVKYTTRNIPPLSIYIEELVKINDSGNYERVDLEKLNTKDSYQIKAVIENPFNLPIKVYNVRLNGITQGCITWDTKEGVSFNDNNRDSCTVTIPAKSRISITGTLNYASLNLPVGQDLSDRLSVCGGIKIATGDFIDFKSNSINIIVKHYMEVDQSVKIEIQNGITEVTDALKDTIYNTVEKVTQKLTKTVTSEQGYTEENTALYDVELMVSEDNGNTWVPATAENFPTEGIMVNMPYPEGTNSEDYDFTAVHMFDEDVNGYKAGEVETPEVTETESGISFRLMGTSPVMVGFKKVSSETTTTNNDATSPETGDTSNILLWSLILIGSATCIISATNCKRKKYF